MNQTSGNKPLTAAQQATLKKIPNPKDSKFPGVYETLPASIYTDPKRFEQEQDKVFRKQPVLIGVSASIPEPDMYFRREFMGMPVLVTRTNDGSVNAFVNVCTHRGAKLCPNDAPSRGKKIICPYHAWTFALDGKLIGVPRPELFPGLDKDKLGLVRLPCVEAGGLIWIGLDPKFTPDFSVVQGELEEDMNAMGLADMVVYKQVVFDVKANWKLVMDTMNDSYHVTRLHRNSVGKFFVDAEQVIDPVGPHLRVGAPRANFDKSIHCETFEDSRQIMLFAYTLFPNSIVVPSPDFISVGIIEPVSSVECKVHYFMMANEFPEDEKMRSKLDRSFDLMKLTFAEEDYWAAELCQEGLSAGVHDEVHLGGMETQIPFFHNQIDKCLDKY